MPNTQEDKVKIVLTRPAIDRLIGGYSDAVRVEVERQVRITIDRNISNTIKNEISAKIAKLSFTISATEKKAKA